jgi:hypothetical protein
MADRRAKCKPPVRFVREQLCGCLLLKNLMAGSAPPLMDADLPGAFWAAAESALPGFLLVGSCSHGRGLPDDPALLAKQTLALRGPSYQ